MTLKDFAAELFQRYSRGPDGKPVFGEQWAVTSLTTTTVVVNQLLYGGVGPGVYTDCWIWRPDTGTAADRARICTNYAAATGTLTHAGTNYGDTTATSESVFICNPEWPPEVISKAIDLSVRSLRHYDRTPVPTRRGQQVYWISDLTWLQKPADIPKITLVNRPELGRNPGLEKWNTVSTGGILQPDDYTIAGASATMARSTTANREGRYTLAITRAGTDCTVLQTVSLLANGVSTNDGLIGETLTVWGRVQSAVASQARLRVLDGTQTINSSYHSGGGAIETLSAEIVVATLATTLQFGISVETDNAVVYVDKLRLLWTGDVTDSHINDAYDLNEWTLPKDSYKYDQGSLRFFASGNGLGRQYILHSNRPYPGFDQTRLNAGTADLDVNDAPLETVAVGAAYFLFRGRYGADDERTVNLRREWDSLALSHLYREPRQEGGIQIRPNRLAVAPGRMP